MVVLLSLGLQLDACGQGRLYSVAPSGADFQSLHEAVAATEAGDTLRIRGGTYSGPVGITKPLTLLGKDWPHIKGTGDTTVVTIGAPNVTLSGFRVSRSGANLREEDAAIAVNAPHARVLGNRIRQALFGIYLRKAHHTVIRANDVSGMPDLDIERRGDIIRVWYSDSVRIEKNTFQHGRDAILWFSNEAEIRNNRMLHCRYGLHFMYSDDATIRGNRMSRNAVGAYLMYSADLQFRRNVLAHNRSGSAMGLGLKDMDNGRITNNILADNRVGIFVDNSPRSIDAKMWYRQNAIVYNEIGIKTISYVSRSQITQNNLVGNYLQVQIEGGRTPPTNRTDAWRRNYWSDYRGYDADGDRAGEIPYQVRNVFGRLLDEHPSLQLFLYSPAVESIEVAAETFPILQPEPWLTDSLPQMEAYSVAASSNGAQEVRGSIAAAAGICLLFGLGVFLWGFLWGSGPGPVECVK